MTAFSYRFGDRGKSARSGVTQLRDKDLRASASVIHRLGMRSGAEAPWADDLLRIARGAYLADKRSARGPADDGWTRTIFLTVEVTDPELWRPHTPQIDRLLTLLTGDEWRVSCVAGATPYAAGYSPLFSSEGAEVALFSGGLDSTAYAATRMHAGDGPLILVSYQEPDDARYQRKLVQEIERLGDRQVQHYELPIQTFSEGGENLELSARSRGLLFMATAMYVASGHGATGIAVPENGQLAVNPALTPARPAACSTRSVHPTTLAILQRLVAAVGGDIEITNPFAGLTKGEVCSQALRAGLREDALWTTVSCGRPPVRRGSDSFHCGRCFPCLVRRSGLRSAVGRDETVYEHEFGPLAGSRWPDDLYALFRWLTRPFSRRDLLGDLVLPDDTDLTAVMDVLQRGRSELIEMLRSNLPVNDLPVPLRPRSA